VDVCEKYCILRLRSSWFALPAMSLREVVTRPALVAVPATHPVMEGLCHLRAEFLPVLRLAMLLNEDEVQPESHPSQVLVMMGASGPWGISVDQVVALEALEVVINFDDHDRASVVLGSANYRDQIVRVLNHTALLRRAQLWLDKHWQDAQSCAPECRLVGGVT